MDKLFTDKQLGQLRPADTNAVSIYSPTTNVLGRVDYVLVANVTGSAATFRIFYDWDGNTYDEDTALCYDISLAANSTWIFEPPKALPCVAATNLAVRSGTADALNFTVIGSEKV